MSRRIYKHLSNNGFLIDNEAIEKNQLLISFNSMSHEKKKHFLHRLLQNDEIEKYRFFRSYWTKQKQKQ